MRFLGRSIIVLCLSVIVVVTTVWASLALFYRLPVPLPGQYVAAGLFALLSVVTLLALFGRNRVRAVIAYAVAFAAVLFWWNTIVPAAVADWSPDVARQVTGSVVDNQLTLTNVRDFRWRTDQDFTETWTTRSYDLNTLRGVDLFMSYWAGPEMAHVILSFGFETGEQLAWSIEVRRRLGGQFSPVADLFKSNPLVIIAADERDVVGVRSNVRSEDVQIYRLRMTPAAARQLLLEYVADSNALAEAPQFYNSLTTNCTTTIVKMMRVAGTTLPLDWRLIVNGYLPDYAYDHGAVDTTVSLADLRQASHIATRAKEDRLSDDFSRAIRVGVPSPAPRTQP